MDSEQVVNRANIGKIFNAPPEEVMDALSSVAILDENKTWKLLVSDNDRFFETYVYYYNNFCLLFYYLIKQFILKCVLR